MLTQPHSDGSLRGKVPLGAPPSGLEAGGRAEAFDFAAAYAASPLRAELLRELLALLPPQVVAGKPESGAGASDLSPAEISAVPLHDEARETATGPLQVLYCTAHDIYASASASFRLSPPSAALRCSCFLLTLGPAPPFINPRPPR